MGLEEVVEGRKTAMTVAEVATMLSVSQRLVYQLVSIGEIPHFKVGAAVRFDPKALASWLREKLKQSGKEREFNEFEAARKHSFDSFGGMTPFWSEVLLPKERSGNE